MKGCVETTQTIIVQVPATIIGDLISASVKIESGVALQGKIVSKPQQTLLERVEEREESFTPIMEPVQSK